MLLSRIRSTAFLSLLGVFVAAVLAVGGVLASSASAALPDLTWSGLAPFTGTRPGWSDPRNWLDGVIPTASSATVDFPALTSPDCSTQTPTATCNWSENDLSGLSVTAVRIDDGYPYRITGNPVGLGAGGITAAPSAGDTDDSPFVWLPFKLTAPQTWSVTGGANQGLALAGAVTGSSTPLTIALNDQAFLALYADAEVGDVTVTGNGGPSTLLIGHPDNPAAFNNTTGNSINIRNGVTVIADPAATGPLMIAGGRLQVGDAYRGDSLSVNGGVTVDSTTTVSLYIRRPGTRAGTDFSQLSATGDVNLGGASLDLSGVMGLGEVQTCPVLTPGDVDTLVTTTGSLTGTFAGVPDGATIQLSCPGGDLQPPTVRINYTAHAVTATVMTSDGTPSATTLSANPAGALTTNQSVTLTAAVSADSGATGTVEFDANATPIAACRNQPLAYPNGVATATCQTAFAAASPRNVVTAVFRPFDGTELQGSSDVTDLLVGKGSTATRVSVSDPAPEIGKIVTYAATVAPNQAGATKPLGAVQFLDDGIPIDACGDPLLTAGASAPVTTCTLSYSTSGRHSITAAYAGDDNFTGSTSSPAQLVIVSPPSNSGSAASSSSGSLGPSGSRSSTSGALPATPTTPAAMPVSPASAPSCKLLLSTHRVGESKRNPRTLRLRATCDQDTDVTLRGTITRMPGATSRRRKVFRLGAAHASLKAWQARRLVITVPGPALLALQRGSRETATFTLSATGATGTTHVFLRVPRLKW